MPKVKRSFNKKKRMATKRIPVKPKERTRKMAKRRKSVSNPKNKSTTKRKRSTAIKTKTGGGELQFALTALASGVGASFLANLAPIPNNLVKASIPAAAGVLPFLVRTRMNDSLRAMATGAIFAGGLSIVKSLMPTVPLLAGEDDYILIPANTSPQVQGDYRQIAGEYRQINGSGFKSPASR